ncbi:MAG: ABC transporter transmembrane domain-containing protein, partial [Betaproteobacteria bacterium]
MLSFFEKRVDPYPAGDPATPPQGFAAFLWSATQGMRPLILGMTLCTAAIGMFEALLFAMLGNVVDWLTQTPVDELWERQRTNMLLLGGILLASPLLVLVQTLIKHQALAGNFPMRLRWVFHRHMLGQSLAFYQDEFAGRVATKVMQTALAVRDTWMIVADIMVFVGIYFITMVAVVGSFDAWVLLPFLGWLALYVLALVWFVPRLGKVAKAQADARSLMVGRITDAYTNIATVKLFSHGRREATFAKGAMQEFMGSVHAQMRLITGVEITNHVLSMA